MHKLNGVNAAINAIRRTRKHVFLTARPGVTYTTAEQIKDDWYDGKEFRMYGVDGLISNAKTLEMKMRGVTHLEIIYQDPNQDMKARSVVISL